MKYNSDKTQKLNKRLIFLFGAMLSAVVFILCGAFFHNFAKAISPVNADLYLPATEAEYYSLSSPTEIFYSEDYLIINDNNELLISKEYGSYVRRSSFTNLSYIKSFDTNELLLTDTSSIYKYDIENDKKTLLLSGGEPIGSIFDYNGSYLITSNANKIILYTLSDTVAKIEGVVDDTYKDSPVAANSENKIFYLTAQKTLCISNVGTLTDKTLVELPISPTELIANDKYVYCINKDDSKIISVSLSDYSLTTLAAPENSDYDLSNIKKTSGICFKGDNLLVADAELKAVSEFSIDGETLSFTGFAVAKGKTAYNRIGSGVQGSDIFTVNGKTAVYDGYKITVWDKDKNFDNILIDNVEGFSSVDRFALGENSLAIANDESKTIRIINVGDKENRFETDTKIVYGNKVKGLKYVNGNYYVLVTRGDTAASGKVFRLSENTGNLTELFSFTDLYTVSSFPEFTVTIDGDFYLTDTKNKKIVSFNKADGYEAKDYVSYDDVNGIVKLGADMGGALFALKANSVLYFINDDIVEMPLSVSANAVSFALNYDEKIVSFIFENEEFVYTSSSLPNMAANDFTVPEGYSTVGENADISNLKIYSINDDINAYSVVRTEKDVFAYNGIYYKNDCKYVFVDQLDYVVKSPDGNKKNDRTRTFYILATLSDAKTPITVAVQKDGLTDQTVTFDTDTEKVFVTTDVNMYYLPIITENDSFAVYRNDTLFRISKNAEIKVYKIFNFIERDFYYAEYTVGDNTITGYVPTKFTVKILSDDVITRDFKYGTLKKTTVYSNVELSSIIKEVEENTTAKIYETSNGVTEIAIQVDGAWIQGYVKSEAVTVKRSDTVRNALIITALSVSVFATSLFIIFRKKK